MLLGEKPAAEQVRLARLADLTVKVGANVQPGQLVVINALVDNAPLAREIARAAYRAGARRVEPRYFDPHFTRALVELGPEESLGETTPWHLEMLRTLRREQGCYIQVTGDAEPSLLSDLPGKRVGKAGPRAAREEWLRMVADKAVNWTIVAAPTPAWASQVFGKPDMPALWDALEKAVRLDTPDPVAKWRRHLDKLNRLAVTLTERRFESLRYRGPGTDLVVGLLPSGRWTGGEQVTSFGVRHVDNMPTEEVFTSPDCRRADGRVRSTRPLEIFSTVVEDLELELRDGRIVEVRARTGAEVVRSEIAVDENAGRLGELALVDGSSAVGKLGLTFSNGLFDENATSHIAYGAGFGFCVDDESDRAAGLNQSAIHTDFMVGGADVQIDGKERGGGWVPILHDNKFRIA